MGYDPCKGQNKTWFTIGTPFWSLFLAPSFVSHFPCSLQPVLSITYLHLYAGNLGPEVMLEHFPRIFFPLYSFKLFPGFPRSTYQYHGHYDLRSFTCAVKLCCPTLGWETLGCMQVQLSHSLYSNIWSLPYLLTSKLTGREPSNLTTSFIITQVRTSDLFWLEP